MQYDLKGSSNGKKAEAIPAWKQSVDIQYVYACNNTVFSDDWNRIICDTVFAHHAVFPIV